MTLVVLGVSLFGAVTVAAGTMAASSRSDSIVDLGTLGGTESHARAVNGRGQVVGSSNTASDAETHATLWQT